MKRLWILTAHTDSSQVSFVIIFDARNTEIYVSKPVWSLHLSFVSLPRVQYAAICCLRQPLPASHRSVVCFHICLQLCGLVFRYVWNCLENIAFATNCSKVLFPSFPYLCFIYHSYVSSIFYIFKLFTFCASYSLTFFSDFVRMWGIVRCVCCISFMIFYSPFDYIKLYGLLLHMRIIQVANNCILGEYDFKNKNSHCGGVFVFLQKVAVCSMMVLQKAPTGAFCSTIMLH